MTTGRSRLWSHRALPTKLTVVAALSLAVALALASLAMVVALHRSLFAALDDEARTRVHLLEQSAQSGQPPVTPLTNAREDAAEQIVDPHGHVLASTENVAGLDPIVSSARPGRISVRTADVPQIPDHAGSYRVASVRTANGYDVIVALPSDDLSDTVDRLEHVLAVVVPIVFVVLVGISRVLVGLALRPVERLRAQAAAVPVTDMGRRLEVPTARDELRSLATTLNDLIARVDAAARRQEEFVADAAHELRSPLSALRARLEVAIEHPDHAALEADLPGLHREVVRLGRLVENLLALARSRDGIPPVRHPVDLDDVLRAAVAGAGGRPGIRVDASGVRPVRVSGDADALRRVVDNLLDNALRHARSEVTVGLTCRDGNAIASVADDGPGVADSDRERVFERFVRVDDARSRDDGGAGLGLAIVKTIIEAHGGDILIEDAAPGARVVVRLPSEPG